MFEIGIIYYVDRIYGCTVRIVYPSVKQQIIRPFGE